MQYRTLTYAGKSLSDFGVWWDNSQVFSKPAKLFDSYSIPNRNGALFASLNKYENIQIEYSCFIKEDFAKNYSELIDYLTSFDTYQELANSVEPNTYRMALFKADLTVETGQFLKDGMFTLVFDCKPQMFLKMGDNEVELAVTNKNEWTDTAFSLDGITVNYNSGIYNISGSKATTSAASQTRPISIPSAGTWRVTAQVMSPDYQNGSHASVTLAGQRMLLNAQRSVTTTITASGAGQFPFLFSFNGGWTGTLRCNIQVVLIKQISATRLLNPTRKKAKPIFRYVEVSENTSIYMNGSRIIRYIAPTGISDDDGDLIIDCELMDCYLLQPDGGVVNYNPYVTLDSDFPELTAGLNTMSASNGTVYVKPKWWRL